MMDCPGLAMDGVMPVPANMDIIALIKLKFIGYIMCT